MSAPLPTAFLFRAASSSADQARGEPDPLPSELPLPAQQRNVLRT
uniref:Uncharacterized protein n=1 Tax=Rhizobium rhizogenes TaxID=359 RepID=A0A7S5DSP5_RHIRH|nr:hypothetical protein pC5.7c_620 [Rhizobium rhizogenes]